MKKLVLLIVILVPAALWAQSYNVLLIPDSLKKGADFVVRTDEYTLEIKSPGKATMKEKHAYTILNEAAAKYAGYYSRYDRFTSINYINAVLYDASGKELRHVKKKDMEDVSGSGESSLMDDSRYKKFDFYHRNYPYTVEFEEEDDIDGVLHFDSWMPLHSINMSVADSRYIIIAPKDYTVRYKASHCTVQAVIAENGNKKIYTWEAKNLPAIPYESDAPDLDDIVPHIRFAPSDFEMEGYKGNMNTWEGFGKFVYELLKGRDILPDDIKAKVHQLTDPLKDDKQKVYALYNFMQQNTRYISVQLGIGGWQPFDAKYVATKRYGDCKALSNYMIALLKEAGIKARYVIIKAGADASPLVDDFPSLQGNHAISCVPMGKDTMWLECTSQTVSPGFMGSFTGDRKAILIDEQGGHIVNTPRYSANENQQNRTVNATIDAEGNLEANVNTRFTGVQEELPHMLMYDASNEQRTEYLNMSINLPTYQVDKSKYEEEKGTLPAVKEYLHVTSPAYASITGKRLFIAPNLFNKSRVKFNGDSARKYDIVFNDSFRDIDSIHIKIPAGYVAESLPSNVTIEGRFGRYSNMLRVDGENIYYTRLYEKSRSRFPASDYPDLIKFQDRIYRADRARIVLVKHDQ